MSGFVIPSEDELASGQGGDASGDGQPKLLPEDQYVARVESIEVMKNQTSKFNTTPHDEWKVKFDILSFVDGSPLVYDDDSVPDPTKDVRLTTFFDPSKTGMIPQPAKTRKFVTAALGVAIGDRIEMDDPTTELIGKRLVVTTAHKTDGKGILRDRIVDLSRIRKARGSGVANEVAPTKAPAKSDADVEAEADAKLARAHDTFDDELKF